MGAQNLANPMTIVSSGFADGGNSATNENRESTPQAAPVRQSPSIMTPVAVVPEPQTYVWLVLGGLTIIGLGNRRRRFL
jgi:hypothetical protein